MSFSLPNGYRQRVGHDFYLDIPGEWTYQPDVYALAHFLADRCGAKYIIDIGCGSGGKLKPMAAIYDLIGIDSLAGIELAKKNLPSALLIEFDLEKGLPHLDPELVKNGIVICSDVIEHLQTPEYLMKALANLSQLAQFVLISTPDRDRARGWLDDGPPENPAHVMEWGASEFVRFMRDCGFAEEPFYGHTINTDFHRAKTTLLTISGTHARFKQAQTSIRVAAIIHVYNELDIITEVIEHLLSQGVEVHIFDNWSNDGTWEALESLAKCGKIANLERFPSVPTEDYQWHSQLEKTQEYAVTLDADWIMHHDADEIRVSPWEKATLQQAFNHIDFLGYNAVDFTVIDFRFLAKNLTPKKPYQQNLTHFEFGRRPGHFLQIKAWKNNKNIELASSGGHEAIFNDRKIFPFKFLLKHYPLRTQAQAEEKVFKNRLPRFGKEQRQYNWHTQYNKFQHEATIAGWDTKVLTAWHQKLFMTEFLVERLSGIGLSDHGAVPNDGVTDV